MHSHLTLQLERPLQRLLRMQARGKIRRTVKRLSSPRRLVPAILVAILLGLYAVKVYIAMMFHNTTTEVPIAGIAPVGMLYILLLKLLGVCINRKKSGARYRQVEQHQLIGGPFPLQQVRLFRVAGHAVSIFLTSLFAGIFFAYHVTSVWAATSGAYLAMLFTYLVYTAIAVVAYRLPEKAYRQVRMLGCGAVGTMVAWILYRVSQQGVRNFEFLQTLGDEVIAFSQLPVISAAMSPFFVFTNVIVAKTVPGFLFWIAVALFLNYVALQVLLYVEVALDRKAEQWERQDFRSNAGTHKLPSQTAQIHLGKKLGSILWFGGMGPIVWRQLKGVLRLKSGLCWLLIPLASALAVGAYIAYDPASGVIQTVAVIVVTTSVFLPGLLPFDFRGDLHGLPALKMMPIHPTAVVLGQLIVPVGVLTAFQLAGLSTILFHDITHWRLVLATLLFLLPTNIIILALENLIFLLYPYRIAEFDMQATVRRVVMLMAKLSIVFLAVVVTMLAAFAVVWLKAALETTTLGEILRHAWKPILIVIEFLALYTVAAGVITLTCHAYCRFDLSDDLPV